MSKKKVILIASIIVIVAIIILIIGIKNYFFVSLTDSERFSRDYERLNGEFSSEDKKYPNVDIGDNKMVYKSIDEVLQILYDGVGVIYIGYPECIYCRSAAEVLSAVANKNEIEEIYYLDISEVWDIKTLTKSGKTKVIKEAHPMYEKLLDRLGNYFLEDYIIKDNSGKKVNTGEKRIKAPIVLFVVDGEIVSSNINTMASHDDPYIELNENEFWGVGQIYQYGINDVMNRLNAGY